MYDDQNDETISLTPNYDETARTEAVGIGVAFAQSDGDQTGVVANFIRDQPVFSLSLGFGLGLLATSLLARKRT
jgi:hypothetical protein